MKIFLIGQCSLHWGRMEFGNIGNYYIIEPFVRELHKLFPGLEIKTTFQMSKRFCESEQIKVVPMELYYGWNDQDLITAEREIEISNAYASTGRLVDTTPYITEVLWSDLVVDFSGDIWGDNANFLGKDRFKVGLYKDLVAQQLGKPTAMIAGSPGPFSDPETQELAKKVFENFDLVTNRERISVKHLDECGFNTHRVVSLACPAFLFEPAKGSRVEALLAKESLLNYERPTVGFVLCGWNFTEGPFDKWPREDSEYTQFAEAIEYISETYNARVCLMSHSNGFHIPPAEFELIHGRDYPVIKQLQAVLESRGVAKDFIVLDGIYDAWETKAIIGSFDMLISGRVHAAVAGLSQCIPTVIIDYGHEPKAHKLMGFAEIAGIEDLVADPALGYDIVDKIQQCWDKKTLIKNELKLKIPQVKNLAKENFSLLYDLVSSKKTDS